MSMKDVSQTFENWKKKTLYQLLANLKSVVKQSKRRSNSGPTIWSLRPVSQ